MSSAKPAIVSLGKYHIRGVLGRGAIGVVYDGLDPHINRRVAIKTVRLLDDLDPESQEGLARFKNEAQAAGRLSHRNIVAVYDYGESDETAFIVMEFVDGQSLKERLDTKEPFSIPETVDLMEQVLAGLQFSHDKGVIHRDIKPGNVMLTKDGQVKLADFGIARIESSVMTLAGTVLGTPAYMSPEQLMAQTVDARSDIYSSGVLLYQLLTGERPFEGGLTAIIHKALNTSPPRPSEISVTAPPALDAVVARAMAKRPDDRYQTAAAFARAIREAFEAPDTGLSGLGLGLDDEATLVVRSPRPAADPRPTAHPGPVPAAPAKPAKGLNPALLGGAAVVVLGLIGGGAWFALRPSPSGPAAVGTTLPALPSATPPPNPSSEAANQQPAPVGAPPGPGGETEATNPPPASPTSASPTPPSLALAPATSPPLTPLPPQSPPPASSSQTSSPQTPASPASSSPASSSPASSSQAASPPASLPPIGRTPEQVAMAPVNAAAIRSALNALALSTRCAVPRFAVSDDGLVSASGLVGAGAPDTALRQAVRSSAPGASVAWDARGIDGAYCDVLDIVRPVAQPSGPFLGLTLKDEATRLKAHDLVLPVVKLPEFPAYLLVDYFSHDGSVAHLFPIRGTPNPPFAANATVRLGTTAKDRVEVGPPFGTDVIVATVSSVPLFPPGTVRADETMQTYLPALKAAMEAAQRRNAKITGRALALDTVEQ